MQTFSLVYFYLFFYCIHCYRAGSLNLDASGANSRPLILRIKKWDLDDAHKDKTNKLYSSDFKVSLNLFYYITVLMNVFLFSDLQNYYFVSYFSSKLSFTIL